MRCALATRGVMAVLCGCAALGAAAACSSFGGGPSGGDVPTTDAASENDASIPPLSDASNVADVVSEDAPHEGAAPINLLPDPGFEQVLGACGMGWTSDNAVLLRSDSPHSGEHACSACASGTTTFTMKTTGSLSPVPKKGDSYLLTAWLRLPATDPGSKVSFRPMPDATPPSPGFVPTMAWQRFDYPFILGGDGPTLALEIAVDGTAGTPPCVLLDDLVLVRQ